MLSQIRSPGLLLERGRRSDGGFAVPVGLPAARCAPGEPRPWADSAPLTGDFLCFLKTWFHQNQDYAGKKPDLAKHKSGRGNISQKKGTKSLLQNPRGHSISHGVRTLRLRLWHKSQIKHRFSIFIGNFLHFYWKVSEISYFHLCVWQREYFKAVFSRWESTELYTSYYNAFDQVTVLPGAWFNMLP